MGFEIEEKEGEDIFKKKTLDEANLKDKKEKKNELTF